MRVRAFQEHIAALYLAKDQRRGLHGTLLWLVEEMGEVAEAARRDEPHLADELADLVAWTASVANLKGIDLEAALARKYPAGACRRCGRSPCACEEPAVTPL